MNNYDFEVIVGKCNGCVSVYSRNENDAFNKVSQYIGEKLRQALPELNIEFGVNLIRTNNRNITIKNEIKNNNEILTKEEAVRRHRELWNKVAEIIERDGLEEYEYECDNIKSAALKELGYNPKYVKDLCWCCEFIKYENNLSCKMCPIQWSSEECNAYCSEAEFGDFWDEVENRDEELAYEFAKIIANLPEREDED